MRLRGRLTIVAIVTVGCGIDAVGTGATAPAEAPTGDTAATSGGPPPPAGAKVPPGSACSVPDGWGVVAYAPSRASACPPSYSPADVVTDAVAEDGACSCSCSTSTTDPPSCAKGTNFSGLQGSSTCDNATVAFNVNGTGCVSRGGTAYTTGVARYKPLPLYRGACMSSPKEDVARVKRTEARTCVPEGSAIEEVCRGVGPQGFAACIAHDGDLPCPEGSYTRRVVAGANAVLACGGCATCQNEATCSNATMRYYDDSGCTSQVGVRTLNDVCNALSTGSTGAAFTHFRYDVTMSTPACVAAPASTSLALETPRTICCR